MTRTFKTREEFEEFCQAGKLSIQGDNPRLCLSPNRYFGKCYECPAFKTAKKQKICESAIIVEDEVNKQQDIKEEIKQLKTRIIKLKEGVK